MLSTWDQYSNHSSNPAGTQVMAPLLPGLSLPQTAARQIDLIYDTITEIIEWIASRVPLVSKQAGSRRNAAYLEVVERYWQQLQGYLTMLALADARCEDFLTQMMGLCLPEFAASLPKLLRTGNELGRVDQEETDGAWRAFLEHLQMLPDEAKRGASAADLSALVAYVRKEITALKQAIIDVANAFNDLDLFKGCIAFAADKQVSMRKKPAQSAMSPEDYESCSRRSDAAAAALLEEVEAEKAANHQKPQLPVTSPKTFKKSKAKTKPQHSPALSPVHESNSQAAGKFPLPSSHPERLAQVHAQLH